MSAFLRFVQKKHSYVSFYKTRYVRVASVQMCVSILIVAGVSLLIKLNGDVDSNEDDNDDNSDNSDDYDDDNDADDDDDHDDTGEQSGSVQLWTKSSDQSKQ